MTDRRIVIGMDGGGTTTRALAVDLTGRRLACALSGSASPSKSPQARDHVRQAILEVTAQAGRTLSDVAALVAGLAGLDDPEDQVWADDFTAFPEITGPRRHVNDAVVAHAGALESRPGIIAIAGTGSIVYGVTEAGEAVRNYDFHCAPPTQARSLAYSTMHALLAGEAEAGDREFGSALLDFWEVGSLDALRALGRQGFVADRYERSRRFGEMAPLITAAAAQGAPLARRECDRAAEALARSIRLVGGCFAEEIVRVALIGSFLRSPYMQAATAQRIAKSSDKHYRIEEPAFSGEAGAALMALTMLGIALTDEVSAALRGTAG